MTLTISCGCTQMIFQSIMDANTNNITNLLLQVIAYFIIMAIQYFRKYRLPYQKLVNEFRNRIANIIAEMI